MMGTRKIDRLFSFSTVIVSILIALAVNSCERHPSPETAPPAGPATPAAPQTPPPERTCAESCRPCGQTLTDAFLDQRQPACQAAIANERAWLDHLSLDPFDLRQQNIKGKKKLAELLGAYYRIYSAAAPEAKPALLTRIQQVAAVTFDPRYHDLAALDDEQFKQDATSYLRIAYLLDRLGLDIAMYRDQLLAIKPRLDGHMKDRGSHQQMAFHWYYGYFSLAEPFPLDRGFEKGIIHSRRDYNKISKMDAYSLTHEIFVPYGYGDNLDPKFFNEDEQDYLRKTLDRLTVYAIMQDDPDLAGELLSCLSYLRFTDLPVYREGLAYLLTAQRPDGAWGNYERLKDQYGDYVDQAFYLHTTEVAGDALIAAFDFRDKK